MDRCEESRSSSRTSEEELSKSDSRLRLNAVVDEDPAGLDVSFSDKGSDGDTVGKLDKSVECGRENNGVELDVIGVEVIEVVVVVEVVEVVVVEVVVVEVVALL